VIAALLPFAHGDNAVRPASCEAPDGRENAPITGTHPYRHVVDHARVWRMRMAGTFRPCLAPRLAALPIELLFLKEAGDGDAEIGTVRNVVAQEPRAAAEPHDRAACSRFP
jgi:hypothetical protein